MTLIKPNGQDIIAGPNGQRTIEDTKIMTALYDKVVELETRLDAIAAVTGPSGGATIDTESRTAISAILSAAS